MLPQCHCHTNIWVAAQNKLTHSTTSLPTLYKTVGNKSSTVVEISDQEQPCPIFGPCLLRPNGWMDQDGTWHGGGSWSRPHCVRWEPSSPPKKGAEPQIFGPFLLWPNGSGRPQPMLLYVKWRSSPPPQQGAELPIFGSRLLWPNGCMDQDTTWYGGRPRPTQHCVRWGPSSPP